MINYQVKSNVIMDGKKICIDDLPEAEQISILTNVSLAAGRRYAEALDIQIIGESDIKLKELENI